MSTERSQVATAATLDKVSGCRAALCYLRISDAEVTCDVSSHWAWRDGEAWVVSWLPMRLNRTQAIAAMMLVAINGSSNLASKQRKALVARRAAELGLSGADAVARILETEQQAERLRNQSLWP